MLDEKNLSISASLDICSSEDIIESNRMSKSFWQHSYADLSVRERSLSVVKRIARPLIGCCSCRLISRSNVNKSMNDGIPIRLFIERIEHASTISSDFERCERGGGTNAGYTVGCDRPCSRASATCLTFFS